MINSEEYLRRLDRKSVWVFTKQKCDFDSAFRATNLFDDIPNKEDTNIEDYFSEHHEEYGIDTYRHRILVIPQFLGLLTKTPFYKKGGNYSKERPTVIYEKFKIATRNNNMQDYNMLKTEQMLKIKIHAIIDTADNNEDYHILPVIFMYKVLKELQLQHNIKSITLEQLYTYILTCKEYEQWEQAVFFIKNNEPTSNFVSDYKSLCRFETLVRNNINLFIFNNNTVSINPDYDDYFYEKFMLKYDLEEMNEILYRDVDYSYFLYNFQDFGINLIDAPNYVSSSVPLVEHKEIIRTEHAEDEENDENYNDKIDNINDSNVNVDVAVGAHNVAPVNIDKQEISKKYKRNPLLGKIAIHNAYYSCEHNPNHETFISEKTKKNFMEAHHLVPVKFQKQIWRKYGINVDCVENIVSLCPTCHRAFHNGTKEVKKQIIETVYNRIIPRYRSINFNITLEEIEKLYNIK